MHDIKLIRKDPDLFSKKLLDRNFNSSLNYKIQGQYSDTNKLENKTIENLLNKTLQEILIDLSRNISS